jgi:hypothetical protein
MMASIDAAAPTRRAHPNEDSNPHTAQPSDWCSWGASPRSAQTETNLPHPCPTPAASIDATHSPLSPRLPPSASLRRTRQRAQPYSLRPDQFLGPKTQRSPAESVSSRASLTQASHFLAAGLPRPISAFRRMATKSAKPSKGSNTHTAQPSDRCSRGILPRSLHTRTNHPTSHPRSPPEPAPLRRRALPSCLTGGMNEGVCLLRVAPRDAARRKAGTLSAQLATG